jgi:hypothetical protein
VILSLSEIAAGTFEASTKATIAGLYRIQINASGSTLRGLPFTREQLLTAPIFRGGDNPITPGDVDEGHQRLCKLLRCLLNDPGILQVLKKNEVDPKGILRCVDGYCSAGHRPEIIANRPSIERPVDRNLVGLAGNPELKSALDVFVRALRTD